LPADCSAAAEVAAVRRSRDSVLEPPPTVQTPARQTGSDSSAEFYRAVDAPVVLLLLWVPGAPLARALLGGARSSPRALNPPTRPRRD